jgi:hypothetical protein
MRVILKENRTNITTSKRRPKNIDASLVFSSVERIGRSIMNGVTPRSYAIIEAMWVRVDKIL